MSGRRGGRALADRGSAVESTDGFVYHLATGFVTSAWRDALTAQFGDDHDGYINAFDAQLRRAFGSGGDGARALAPMAGGFVFDWTRHAPYIECGYSGPMFSADGDSTPHFRALAEPELQHRRFFAGEHSSGRAAMTAHAALLSGEKAARQVSEFLTRAKL